MSTTTTLNIFVQIYVLIKILQEYTFPIWENNLINYYGQPQNIEHPDQPGINMTRLFLYLKVYNEAISD